MNGTVVASWFADFERLVVELKLRDSSAHIWNCDETGLQEHFVQGRVISETGQPCYQVTSNEKGETTTVVACFNAFGDFCPPSVIFKAKRMKAQWLIGSPPGTVARVSDNGWITAEIFLEWAKSFINFLLTADGCPHILLFDGHSTHIYNLEFLDLMKANNVHPFIFPPHTTHWLQPADRSFFKSLKNNWNSEGVQAVTRSGGKGFGKQGFFGIFTPAWTKSCTIELAQSGFRACGVFPLNPNGCSRLCICTQ